MLKFKLEIYLFSQHIFFYVRGHLCQIFKTICYLSQGESQKIAHEDSHILIVTTTIIVN